MDKVWKRVVEKRYLSIPGALILRPVKFLKLRREYKNQGEGEFC